MADRLREQLQTTLGAAYTIERELGGGGMSRVFVATERALDRRVVVKVLPPDTAASVSLERFNREIQLAAKLQHPHIVPLHSAGEIGGLPYFTMPFVEGESLRTRLAKHGEMPVSEATRVLREIASALAYAHTHGIVHRDIKPDNVLLSGGSAMVTDFGVAKALSSASDASDSGITSVGVALGTPAYMSPEQASADPSIDHRADIYAFGILAYELLTGQTPFGGRTPQGLLAAHVTESPEPIQKRRPSVPAPLAALVMRCLEKRPADRPQTAEEMVHTLDALSTPSSGMQPASMMAATSVTTPTNRSRARLGVSLLFATVLIILAAIVWRVRTASTSSATPLVTSAPKSIAVVPLENAGGDSTMQFFADGMTDELTSTIAKLRGVHVASLSSTRSAVKVAGDARAAGQRLAVGAVLEGRIRRVGDHMRLTASLTNVADGVILWTDTFDGDVRDVFKVQDSIAHAIAGALRVSLAGDSTLGLPRGTSNSEAHDLYLRARYLEAQNTEADFRRAIELFQQAVAKDPRYAEAWAGIADEWIALKDDYVSPREAMPRIEDALRHASAIDPDDAALKFSQGSVALFGADPVAAERLMSANAASTLNYKRVIYYAMALWTNGKRDSAASFVRQAVDRDPTSPVVLQQASRYFFETGDLQTSRAYCDRLKELHVRNICMSRFLGIDGQADSALAFMQPVLRSVPVAQSMTPRMVTVETLVRGGRRAEALALVQAADREARAGKRYVRADYLAKMWSFVGDNDRALTWLERAKQESSIGGEIYWVMQNTPLRKDPRLLAFAKRAGLPGPPSYW